MKKAIYQGTVIVDTCSEFTLDGNDVLANNIRYTNCQVMDCDDGINPSDYTLVNGVITFTPRQVQVDVPTEIRMAQCRAQLIIDGKDDDVEALLTSITDPTQQKLYRAYFEYEPIVKRDNVMINEMAPILGIDLDAFFISASKL